MPRFVGIGGGTGLSVLLRGLKDIISDSSSGTEDLRDGLSAIVCVSDNGGSTGRLRQSFGIPAVGDLRNCLVALSDRQDFLAEVFQYRFNGDSELTGHSLGNLIVTALFQLSGNLAQAIQLAAGVLGCKGEVFPVTEAPLTLCAEFDSGDVVRGECEITSAQQRIRKVWLEPERPAASDGVVQALLSADCILLGPGSLYTSIIPNLLVPEVVEAIQKSEATKISICNLMTQPGETTGFSASDHLRIIETYLGSGVIDVCILNSRPIQGAAAEAYFGAASQPVSSDPDEIARMGIVPVVADLFSEEPKKVRHDALKLARLISSLTGTAQRGDGLLSGEERLVA